jgi:cell division protein FtsB
MENINIIATLFGTLITLLLSVVAYFIKQLHTDFKSMEKDLVEVKTMALIIKTEFKSGNDLLNQKVEYLEKRVQKIELTILKNQDYEK